MLVLISLVFLAKTGKGLVVSRAYYSVYFRGGKIQEARGGDSSNN